MITYRPATPEDLPAVAKLWQMYDDHQHSTGMLFEQVPNAAQAWLASFERTSGKYSFIWVAEQDGQIGAFLAGRVKRAPAHLGGLMVGEISDVYVDERLRGQKVGAHLAELAREHFSAMGLHSIELTVLCGNQGGVEFWQKQGYQPELIQYRLKL